MEQLLKSDSKLGQKFRSILVVLFVGVLGFATVRMPFGSNKTAAGAQSLAMFPPASDLAVTPQRIYVQDWDHIVVLDANTGQLIHQIPLDQYSYANGISLAIDSSSGRLFVTDRQWDSTNHAIDTLTVYRTNDWSIERQLLVPDISLYFGNAQSSIAVSSDGKSLYVYNYNDRERKAAEPVRYWLSILDLTTWSWLPHNIDLQDCGAARLFPIEPNQLYVLCYDSTDVRVVDVSKSATVSQSGMIPVQSRSRLGLIGVSSATVVNGIMYLVSENREVHIKNPLVSQADRILTGAASNIRQIAGGRVEAQKIVPFQAIGLSSDGQYLLVPTGTEEERSHGIASEIVMISTESGEVIRALHPQPFLGITFTSDGTTAFTIVAAPDIPKHFGIKLVRLDLATGAETEIFSGALLPGMVVTP